MLAPEQMIRALDSDSDLEAEIYTMGRGEKEKASLLGSKGSNSSNSHTLPAEETQPNVTAQQETKYPKGVFFIIGNEFCERFSYYGMRAILVIYLTDWLGFTDNMATAVYHSFIVLCYVMPLFGGMLADGYLGKYKTIMYLSIVYAIGNLVMSLTAFPPPFWLGPMIGLALIGMGTGGIKPCVSAFGGDQFSSDQEKELTQFFSLFYFAINVGSLLSMVITPLVRSYIRCFDTSCYSLAFGIPAALMILSLVLFIAGKSMYKIVPSKGNVVAEMFKCTGRAIKNRCRKTNGPKEHWLDYADDNYEESFIEDLKLVYRVFTLFLVLPIFWALFDQQGSRWTLQAVAMDRKVGTWQVPPDLMQSLNPVLIIIIIPLSETLIYPSLAKCNINFKLLQRMVVGMALAAVAFVIAGFIQMKIQDSQEGDVSSGHSAIRFINGSPCPVTVTSPLRDTPLSLALSQGSELFEVDTGTYTAKFDAAQCAAVSAGRSTSLSMVLKDGDSYHVVVAGQADQLKAKLFEYKTERPKKGGGLVDIIYTSDTPPYNSTVTLSAHGGKTYVFNVTGFLASDFQELEPDTYEIYASYEGSDIPLVNTIKIQNGGIYTLVIQPDAADSTQLQMVDYSDISSNSVSVLYQIPQYIIITLGEILFSVSGLAFAYAQAPKSMKSVVGAAWLMTVAGGNIIDIIIAGGGLIEDQAVEFFVFAALMAAMTVIFAVQAYFYQYVNLNGTGYQDPETDTDALDPHNLELTTGDSDTGGATSADPEATHPKQS